MKTFKRRIITFIICTGLILSYLPIPAQLTQPVPVYAAAQDTLPLILNKDSVDYMSFIPEIKSSDTIEEALDITNPEISIDASSAILLKSDGTVLYHKNASDPIFPASTIKLLTALVALDWCRTDEKVKVGNELEMIPEDASVAGLKQGETLYVSTLLAAMLLPSGNDAAYVMAAYVGRKSLKKPKAKAITAVEEFVRLMNKKAKKLGAENSCFVTPDGYDAIGQYTTVYDMGRIALAAVKSKTILKVTKQSSLTVKLISGEKYTWKNTNYLIRKDSNWYNPNVIGLKTGSTSIAGRCLISAAQSEDGIVISVVMDSTLNGRWNDSNKLLKYGLKEL